MLKTNRRDFAALVGGTAAVAAAADSLPPAEPPPHITLGRTGITMSRMGFGTGVGGQNRSSALTRRKIEESIALFRHCYDRGITFYDLADWYGTHIYYREALRHLPRERLAIMTKFWWRDDGDPEQISVAHRKQSIRATLRRFNQELGTNYIDMMLLHCLAKEEWVTGMEPYMEVLTEAKEKGEIRALGVSCHDFGALRTAVDQPWVEVILARLNPYGVKCDAPADEVLTLLQRAQANGKAVIGMKIYGAGKLKDKRDECMRYAQTCGVLDAMTIGAVTSQQVDENLALMAQYPEVKRFSPVGGS